MKTDYVIEYVDPDKNGTIVTEDHRFADALALANYIRDLSERGCYDIRVFDIVPLPEEN